MSRGGARFGAGRPGTHGKAEALQRVDVREWARRGLLNAAKDFTWSWRRGDEPAGSISVWMGSPEALTLRFSLQQDGQARAVSQPVRVANTLCHYGGSRPWFLCPCCARLVAVLYLRAGRFACRHCQRVAYSSQSEDFIGRLWRKQWKIEARLGEHWRRPKGMRRKTHERLFAALLDFEEQRDRAFVECAARLFGCSSDWV